MKLSDTGAYAHQLHVADARSRPWLWLVAAGWSVSPFFIRTVTMNPGDMIWLQYVVQGLVPPHDFTPQQTAVGFIEALIAMAVLLLAQLVGTVMFYRRAKMDGAAAATPPLWPLAALLPGVIGNSCWFWWSGHFSETGCLIGLSPAWLAFGAEMIINKLGKNFIYGEQAQMFPAAASGPGPVFYHIPE